MARIVVVGGGIAGLAAGLLLGPAGHEVTILEQDAAGVPVDRAEAWEDWERPGVAQFRHIHLFNARGRNLLRDRLPGVLAALRAAGAGEIHLLGPEDDDVVRLTCRRTTYEMVLRTAAEEAAGVRIRPGVAVAGLVAAGRRVTGVCSPAVPRSTPTWSSTRRGDVHRSPRGWRRSAPVRPRSRARRRSQSGTPLVPAPSAGDRSAPARRPGLRGVRAGARGPGVVLHHAGLPGRRSRDASAALGGGVRCGG